MVSISLDVASFGLETYELKYYLSHMQCTQELGNRKRSPCMAVGIVPRSKPDWAPSIIHLP